METENVPPAEEKVEENNKEPEKMEVESNTKVEAKVEESNEKVEESKMMCHSELKLADTELGDKQYVGPDYPTFTDKHKSLMSKVLTKELFEKLKDKKTASGVTLYHVIKTGVDTPHLGVGCTAGDEESWEVFKELFNPVISGWHKGYNPETQKHISDLNPENLKLTDEQIKRFDEVVVSTRIRAARSLRGHCLPPNTTKEDRAAVEKKLINIFETHFTGDLEGKYYPLGGLGEEDEKMLRDNGYLFQKPRPTNLLYYAGAARDWPSSRGIFHNKNHTALAWVNEEDHCRIISMAKGGNIKDVFARFCKISDTFGKNADIMFNDTHGFIGTCPSNLGTGLRASVMVKLEEFNKNVHLLESACDALDLQPRGSAGEHSAAVGAKWDISNKQRIGFSEVQLVQKLIDGLWQILAWEDMLVKGQNVAREVETYRASNLTKNILMNWGLSETDITKVRAVVEEKKSKASEDETKEKAAVAKGWETEVMKIDNIDGQIKRVTEIVAKVAKERGVEVGKNYRRTNNKIKRND
eukprot:UN24695